MAVTKPSTPTNCEVEQKRQETYEEFQARLDLRV